MHPERTIPYGYCQCGCGEKVGLARQTDRKLGYVKGEPVFYRRGHGTRRPIEAFWDFVDTSGDCWEWTGPKDSCGYGLFSNTKFPTGRAHRIIWMMIRGDVLPGFEVCHTCDNRACVNPAHLWLGTHQDNMDDRGRKGRASGGSLPGSSSPHAKLTEDEVHEIRRLWATGEWMQKDLAARFGVSKMTISKIVRRLVWTHI